MGGNNSKLNQNGGGEVLPARIRPLLRQRIEEFRRRRNNGVATVTPQEGGELEGAISKEQLLKNDADTTSHSFARNNGIEETQQQPPKEQRLVEKLSKVVPLPVSECDKEKEKDVEKKAEIIKSVAAGPRPENKANAKNGDDDEKEKEDEEDDNETGRLIGPGSPSFKIYCIEAEKRKKEEDALRDDEKEEQTIAILHQKSPSTDSDESAASASEIPGYPNEVETTQKRKGNKIKKLGAMKKNLLNVKNMQKNRINRMMTCTGNDRRSLLADNN